MTEYLVNITSTCENPPYRGRTYTYDVFAQVKIQGRDWTQQTGSILLQTALQQAACIPFGTNRKMVPFKDDEREWHESYIESCEEIEPGHARVIIKEPYTD